jgi:formate/nitrite transporter FocA (FNT family)
MTEPGFSPTALDALPPTDVARRAADVGVAKAGMPALDLFALAVLAGAFIALGAVFATTVASGAGDTAYGVTRLLAGLAFTLGLTSSSSRAPSSSPGTT